MLIQSGAYFLSPPGSTLTFVGPQAKHKPAYCMSKYLKVIYQIRELLNKVCSIVLLINILDGQDQI